ncbi:hypothetical protein UC34_25475 [Pandoraea vervacti]|uniref:Cytochrome c domain-containing protein n=1 Tax=Pandoraea vervacti TaxID=656178 RepID=A0ABN4UD71_9BURK|nr:hypothetical protein [Pandoraea vervacti]APD11438.1 hypothetical protein UC34_25475 [Pandoraea vervacti]
MRTRQGDGPTTHRRDRLRHPKVRQPFAAVFVSVTGSMAIGMAAAQTSEASGVHAASPVYLARPPAESSPSPGSDARPRHPPGLPSGGQTDWQARDWAMACMTCHNAAAPVTAGKQTLSVLEGRAAAPLMASLAAMRDGRQPATLMPQLLKGYREDELQRIAAYFASQPGAGASSSSRAAPMPSAVAVPSARPDASPSAQPPASP